MNEKSRKRSMNEFIKINSKNKVIFVRQKSHLGKSQSIKKIGTVKVKMRCVVHQLDEAE